MPKGIVNQSPLRVCIAAVHNGSDNMFSSCTYHSRVITHTHTTELSPPLQSPIHQQQDTPITLTLNETLTLRCIDATNNQIQEDNLEFRWFQNYAQIPSATNRQYLLDPTSSGSSVAGYYCCEVLQNQTILNTYCISVVVQGEPNTASPDHS